MVPATSSIMAAKGSCPTYGRKTGIRLPGWWEPVTRDGYIRILRTCFQRMRFKLHHRPVIPV